jgi:nucleoside 2-deoxyribosyltransferase
LERENLHSVNRMEEIKSFFLAGIIQGSKKEKILHSQDYRQEINAILKKYFPKSQIIDPVNMHPHSVDYDYKTGESVFHESIKQATQCDCMIAFLPEASMGTAIEMWECHKNKIPVWTITTMKENWSVKFLSTEIFESLEEFERFLRNKG